MSDAVTRLNAALEGRYAIERELGEGGMATVYLADDLKHERKVALNALKPELAAVVGAERFLAEDRPPPFGFRSVSANSATRVSVGRQRLTSQPPPGRLSTKRAVSDDGQIETSEEAP